MRVAIMGSGGTGGYFGGLLARAGEDVTFFARGAHLAALRTSGLAVTSRVAGDFQLPVHATDDPSKVGPVELILFCVKTYDTALAAEFIKPLVGPDTIVLSLQNGISAAEQVAHIVRREASMGGVALITSAVTAPGAITQSGGPGKIIVGELTITDTSRVDRLLDTFQRAGIPAEAHSAIQVALWEKFIFICAFGGITALTRLPIGPILASEYGRMLLEGVMEEVALVGRAEGISLPGDSVQRALALTTNFEPWARSSLYHDLEAGKRLEVEALNGTVVRLARRHGLSAPFNFVVHASLEPYANGAPVLVPDSSARE